MIKFILFVLALICVAACVIAVMVAVIENKAWKDHLRNERDGES